LHNGRIEQSGIASEVYARPASLWVAEFLGMTNLLEGEVTGLEPFTVRTRCGQFHPIAMDTITAGSAGTLLIKPFSVEFKLSSGPTDCLTGVVEACIFQVDHYMLQVRCADELRFHFSVQSPIRVGERISLHVPPQSLLWFKET
jgi:putative spermidine/putrescine transport system ATP-binding protein